MFFTSLAFSFSTYSIRSNIFNIEAVQIGNVMLLCTVNLEGGVPQLLVVRGLSWGPVSSLEFTSHSWTLLHKQTQNHRASSQLHLLLTAIVPMEDYRESSEKPELTGQSCRLQLTRMLLGRTCHGAS